MDNKGIILKMLCTNPSCSYSETKLEIKNPLNVTKSTGRCTFDVLNACPKCKSGLELLNFVSGTLEIQEDSIN